VGMAALDVCDQPLPELEWLGMWIVNAENANALVNPVQHDASQLFPKRLGFFCFEVERIDVLVFFGWILRVLHRAIWPYMKPFLMFLDVGMVRGALVCQIKSHLESQLFCTGY